VVASGVLVGAIAVGLAPGVASASPSPTSNTSTTNAGYSFAVASSSAVTATFKVPTLTCTPTVTGIGPYVSLENNASRYSYPWLLAECVNSTPVYLGNLTLNGNNSVLGNPVAAGDLIHLSVSMTSKATKITFADATTGVSGSETGPGATATFGFVGVGPIYDSTDTLEGVPAFGHLAFSGVKVGGQTLASTTPVSYNRVTTTSVVQVTTSSIGASGTSFGLTFNHS
jgi:hypothetical protein